MIIYIYKVTNLINGKIYIGVHKTKNFSDGYMGSGKVIQQAIKKYGRENFSKEIIEYFQTYEDALLKEKEIVNEDFLNSENTYNLRRGGFGGFDYINNSEIIKFNGKRHTEETKKLLREKRSRQSPPTKGKTLTEDHKTKIGISTKKSLTGTVKSDAHKKNISNSIKEWHQRRKNSRVDR